VNYTRLGRSGLEVSRICFGTWQFGGDWGTVRQEDAAAAVRKGLDLGVTFFDTAQAYGFGDSEALLADALGEDIRRDDVVVATKGGLRPEGDDVVRDSSPAWIRAGVEHSLRQLGLEAIDLYQVHWPDPDTPFEQTAATLGQLVEEGKVRHVGVSNFDAGQMEEFERTLPVETLQPPYHLFRREIEREVLPWCRDHDVGVLAYGPLAHGLLSGRFSPGDRLPDDDWRSGSELFAGDRFERNLKAVEELERFAGEGGHTVAQLAVAWTLAQPGVHVAITGARRPDHIEGVAPAAEIELSADDLAEIDRIMEASVQVAGPTPEGP
jgi:aryl-alcohol dehydrogenase-like predicted oxidoreductase